MKAGAIIAALLLASAARAQDAAAGQRWFAVQCRACHSMTPGDHKVGPSLAGAFNRKAGTQPGYAYSRALSKAGLVWDAGALDGFLTRPGAAVPGNKMAFAGVADPARRAAIIAYLKAGK